MKTKLLIISLSLLAFVSCKQENSNTAGIDIDSAKKKIESRNSKNGDNKCLLDYVEKRDQLITADEILQMTGFSKENMETDETKFFDDPGEWKYAYLFKNGRKTEFRTPSGTLIKTEATEIFSIDKIVPMTKEEFKAYYKAATDEELDYAKDATKEEVESQEMKDVIEDLTNVLGAIAEGERNVKNLGDLAAYNIVTGELKVLTNGVMFKVVADASDDKKVNQKYAFQMAEMILNKCK